MELRTLKSKVKYQQQMELVHAYIYTFFTNSILIFFSCSVEESDIDTSYHYDTSVSYNEKKYC